MFNAIVSDTLTCADCLYYKIKNKQEIRIVILVMQFKFQWK